MLAQKKGPKPRCLKEARGAKAEVAHVERVGISVPENDVIEKVDVHRLGGFAQLTGQMNIG